MNQYWKLRKLIDMFGQVFIHNQALVGDNSDLYKTENWRFDTEMP